MSVSTTPTVSALSGNEETFCAPIEGYAAIFNVPDQSGDSIAPTAFDDFFSGIVIPASGPRVSMLYQHKVDCPIGCWREFKADRKGLFVRGVLLLGSSKARESKYSLPLFEFLHILLELLRYRDSIISCGGTLQTKVSR